MSKYIFVTGGVCSSLGKGVAAASIGNILESRGLNIQMIKIDPYINVDAGTMSPYQHGEVYVTDDGAETDLDLGNYSRFTASRLSKNNSITTGQIYREVIRKEREGQYLGKTVQVIPHVTDEIKRRITMVGEEQGVDVAIVEIGGTVGDIESIPFLEAARQFIHDVGKNRVLFIHLTLVPAVGGGEFKTKPTQHSAKALREIGIQPDILLCRAAKPLSEEMRRKISLFTNVELDSVISAYDVKTTIYEIPVHFSKQNLDEIVVRKLNLKCGDTNLKKWDNTIKTYIESNKTVRIGIVGKYLNLHDSYKSIFEALIHAGIANKAKIELVKIDSENVEKKAGADSCFEGIHGMLIPGGFGERGIEGMITAACYARNHQLPYFGICLGMQIMVIEYARNVLDFKNANSTEFVPQAKYPVISLLEEQIDIKLYGGTMRLGRSNSKFKENSLIRQIYGQESVGERHRHRYEVSNQYRKQLQEGGLIISGLTPDEELVESVEWPSHPWGIGVQFHPEFVSKPTEPHPLFSSFVAYSLAFSDKIKK
ncbi:MAG: CTP synthase [Spirochaetales bacterium]|nr:CTP synthase [Spirochaetales bacterium]